MRLTHIRQAVLDSYGVTLLEFRGNRRERRIAQARAAFAYWAKIKSGRSFPEIGRMMDRDHTTVLYHARTYPEKCVRYKDPHALACMAAVNEWNLSAVHRFQQKVRRNGYATGQQPPFVKRLEVVL